MSDINEPWVEEEAKKSIELTAKIWAMLIENAPSTAGAVLGELLGIHLSCYYNDKSELPTTEQIRAEMLDDIINLAKHICANADKENPRLNQ